MPFLGYAASHSHAIDDGRKHTFLSAFAERFRNSFTGRTSYEPTISIDDLEEPLPEVFVDDDSLVEFQAVVPVNLKSSATLTAQFLTSLTAASYPISYELVATSQVIIVQFACRVSDRALIEQQLRAHFSPMVVSERTGALVESWQKSVNTSSLIVEFGLSDEFLRPLRTFSNFEIDPLIGIIGTLADLRGKEVAVLQVLMQPTRYCWAESILRSVSDGRGRSFFADAPEMPGLAREKVSSALYAVVIRAAARAENAARVRQIMSNLSGALSQFANPPCNQLFPLSNDDYDEQDHESDLLIRTSHRSGLILNLDELVSFVHLPSPSVVTEKLVRYERKTKPAPAGTATGEVVLGQNLHGDHSTPVCLSREYRLRHLHVIGASGSGKSTLLLNLINQDIEGGRGVGLLDPHGDLIDAVLARIPDDRLDDVILFDPADEDFPIGFNILSAHSTLEKNLLASDLVAVFRRLSTSWGDQMNSVLANAIIAFLESRVGGTLIDLRRFLVEVDYRREFLQNVEDEEIVYFWQREFPLLTGRPQASILTRLDAFLRPKLIRHMVGQKQNRLDLTALMNKGKILLAKLAQGAIGEENAYLLGSFLVSKFHQAAIARQGVPEQIRHPFYLYIDEFHNFVCPSMASILSGARKYGLGLILAHQELRQVGSRQDEVFQAVLANPCTRVCFRVGDDDAHRLADGFATFEAIDLQNLGVGEAIARIEQAQHDFNLKTELMQPVNHNLAADRQVKARAISREKYAVPRDVITSELAAQRLSPPTASTSTRQRSSKMGAAAKPIPPVIIEKLETTSDEQVIEPVIPLSLQRKPPTPGRGGQQHKYLQHLIKGWAERRGFKTCVEETILGGMGCVDVVIEHGDYRLACEITITTTPTHELSNIQKCLAATYSQIVVVSPERRALQQVRKIAEESLVASAFAKLLFLTPEELFTHLEALKSEPNVEDNGVRGYRVKVEYGSVDETTAKARRQAMGNVMLNALKRLKGKRGEKNGQDHNRNGTGEH